MVPRTVTLPNLKRPDLKWMVSFATALFSFFAPSRACAWGNNANGELGDGTTTNEKTPTLVSLAVTPTSIAAEQDSSLAIG